jgi:heme exporter protein CcmD
VEDANHLAFIVAAYGAGIAVVAGLIAWVMLDYRMQSAQLAEFERRGTVRGGAGRAVIQEASEDA